MEALSGKKKLRIKKYPDTCGQGVSKAGGKQIIISLTTDVQQRSTCISRVTVNCFPFDVIVFAMLLARLLCIMLAFFRAF